MIDSRLNSPIHNKEYVNDNKFKETSSFLFFIYFEDIKR